ncbi:MAG: type II toxin-antitoxin system Phd/YefM family antitoxin [Thermodesulfobacteriota bacterium]
MKTAAITELKARLSEYISQVKAGAEIIVTERGRPVARLVPVRTKKAVRDSLASMERQGIIKLGSGRLPDGFWEMARPVDPQGAVLGALLEERGQGR